MRRLFITLCCAICCLQSAAAAAAVEERPGCAGWTINKAGRFRMLSQRMAKFYVQIGYGVDTERAKTGLENSIALFDRQLTEVQSCKAGETLRGTYDDMAAAWRPFRRLLQSTQPTAEQERKVVAASDELMELADQGVRQMQTASTEATDQIVNLSGRERMLSQRMAKLFEAQLWGLTTGDGRPEIARLRNEFVTALSQLERANGNSQRIANQLALARQQWVFFDNALNGIAIDRLKQATDVATTSERILEVMDNLTALYERRDK